MKYKLTPWFSGKVKPVRDGVYERKYLISGAPFCRYEKGRWYCPARTVSQAAKQSDTSLLQDLPWRGVAK